MLRTLINIDWKKQNPKVMPITINDMANLTESICKYLA